MNIREIWALLESDLTAGNGYVQRLISSKSSLDLYLAIERPSNRRMFLFAANRRAFKNQRVLSNSKGLELRKLQSSLYGADNLAYQVILTDAVFNDIFSTLLQDLCDRATSCMTQEEGIAAILNRLSEWQQFLSRRSPAGLTDEEQRGLYGELFFLRRLIEAGFIDQVGISCWTGPTGADQDFQFGRIGVECKVSLAAQNQELLVSNERQLDGRSYQRLFIFHLALATRAGSGDTLPQAVNSVRVLLSGANLVDFESQLLVGGYLDAHRDRYDEISYFVREENYFEVRDDFPRIVEPELRRGVGRVQYSISVPVCKEFAVSGEDVVEAIRSKE